MTSSSATPHHDAAPSARALWLAGAALVTGTALLMVVFPFISHSDELLDLRKIAGDGGAGLLAWLLGVTLLAAGWIGGIAAAQGRSLDMVRAPILVPAALAMLLALLTYPGTAIDVYIYAARSHLLTDYGLDPSTTLPELLWQRDPYVQYVSPEWAGRPSPYGPLWNLIAAPATAVDGERIAVAVMLLKGIMVGAAALTGWLIHAIATHVQPRDAAAATLAWLWSPILLWEGIANGHNDVVLALLLVAAIWAWTRGHHAAVLPLLGMAALLKVVAVILIPAALVATVRRIGWNRMLVRVTLQTAGLSLAVLWVSFAPFYDVPGVIAAIREQSTVVVTSPALIVQVLSDRYDWGIAIREVFPWFGVPVTIAIALIGGVVAWRHPQRLPGIAFEQFFWFSLLATTNQRPWYTIWLVALAATLPLGWPLARAAAWSLGGLVAYGYLLWVQHWFDGSFLVDASVAVSLMLAPTLIVTGAGAIARLRASAG